ncbi:MAG: helix-turn-helix transcriptional regulator [Gemmatimonadota bacterium]
MRITNRMTDAEVVREIGERLQGYRLQQNRTLEEVALAAGVSYRTARRAEAGESRPALVTVVQLLRALGRLEALDAFLPAPTISPIQMARLGGRVRQRAGRPRHVRGQPDA